MKEAIIIPHTHWDREWYFSEKTFRDRLVRVVDTVLESLENNTEFVFQFDGQVAPIIDYLGVKPENLVRITSLVKEGRLKIGPSFVLPDEFLASGEALLRNLEIGIKTAEVLGGAYMVGYYPDTFGHVSQLPQILRLFGITNACLWRGLPDDAPEERDLIWVGAGNTEIQVFRFDRAYNTGYSSACSIAEKEGAFFVYHGGKFVSLENLLVSEFLKSSTNTITLMNGNDHANVQKNLPEIIKKLNKTYPELNFKFGTFEDYFKKVNKNERVKIFGEQNGGTKYTFLLNGTFSSRIRETKQPFYECHTNLLQAETISTITASLAGVPYPENIFHEAWVQLLLNLPHDSICGCSIDRVYEDMAYRFNQVRDITKKIIDDAIGYLAADIDTSFVSDGSLALVVLNTINAERKNLKLEISMPQEFKNFEIFDSTGKKVDYQILSKEVKTFVQETFQGNLQMSKDQNVYKMIIYAGVPKLGYSSFEIRKCNKKRPNNGKFNHKKLWLKINADGSMDLTDNETNTNYRSCNLFINVADAGDEYNFSPIKGDTELKATKARVKKVYETHNGICYKIVQQLSIPAALTKSRVVRSKKAIKHNLTSYVTLSKDSKRIDIATEFVNRSKDHRLRAVFLVPIQADYSYAESPFDFVKRTIREEDLNLEGRVEIESNTYSHQGFFAVIEQNKGLGVITKGLPEYEIKKTGKGVQAELTLVRAVGWLSRDDLLTRKGLAGPPIQTPNAQEEGKHRCEYALIPLAKEGIHGLYKEKVEHNTPVFAAVTAKHEGKLPPNYSFNLLTNGMQLSSLRKRDGKTLLTLYDPINSKKIILEEIDNF